MAIDLPKDDEYWTPYKFSFWRHLTIYAFSAAFLSHFFELVYCLIAKAFGDTSSPPGVFENYLEPYWIYGFAIIILVLLIHPLKFLVKKESSNGTVEIILTFVITSIIALIMELVFGLLMNQPDALGVFPLWDNSHQPLSVLGQTYWLNDVICGVVATLWVWFLYPLFEKLLVKIPDKAENIVAVMIVAFVGSLTIYYYCFV
jgi:hypothetical protein